ncbi:toll/interleukin-1 receptor domain-containing protein [bacterium]|nr:toll/interleukin-1 receptor domain-containing protein [bacterium]
MNKKTKYLRELLAIVSVTGAVASVVTFLYLYVPELNSKEILTSFIGAVVGAIVSIIVLFMSKLFTRKTNVVMTYLEDDRALATDIMNNIKMKGVRLIDMRNVLMPGDEIDRVKSILKASDAVIIILSEKALRSPWMKSELKLIAQYNKRVIPIIATDKNTPRWVKQLFYIKSDNLNEHSYQSIREALMHRRHS